MFPAIIPARTLAFISQPSFLKSIVSSTKQLGWTSNSCDVHDGTVVRSQMMSEYLTAFR
jgi:hypothetical protein